MNKPRIETVDPGFFIRFSTGQPPQKQDNLTEKLTTTTLSSPENHLAHALFIV